MSKRQISINAYIFSVKVRQTAEKWAITFKKFFLDLYEKTDDGKGKLSKEEWQKTAHQFDELLRQADKEEPKVIASKKRGRIKQTKGHNLLPIGTYSQFYLYCKKTSFQSFQ